MTSTEPISNILQNQIINGEFDKAGETFVQEMIDRDKREMEDFIRNMNHEWNVLLHTSRVISETL